MSAQVIQFFNKYTTYVGSTGGGTDYYSAVFDCLNFKSIEATVYMTAITSSDTLTVIIQESADQEQWSDLTPSSAITAGTVTSISKTDTARWIRMKATVVGTDSVATFWSRGVLRED